jgi:protein TonB
MEREDDNLPETSDDVDHFLKYLDEQIDRAAHGGDGSDPAAEPLDPTPDPIDHAVSEYLEQIRHLSDEPDAAPFAAEEPETSSDSDPGVPESRSAAAEPRMSPPESGAAAADTVATSPASDPAPADPGTPPQSGKAALEPEKATAELEKARPEPQKAAPGPAKGAPEPPKAPELRLVTPELRPEPEFRCADPTLQLDFESEPDEDDAPAPEKPAHAAEVDGEERGQLLSRHAPAPNPQPSPARPAPIPKEIDLALFTAKVFHEAGARAVLEAAPEDDAPVAAATVHLPGPQSPAPSKPGGPSDGPEPWEAFRSSAKLADQAAERQRLLLWILVLGVVIAVAIVLHVNLRRNRGADLIRGSTSAAGPVDPSAAAGALAAASSSVPAASTTRRSPARGPGAGRTLPRGELTQGNRPTGSARKGSSKLDVVSASVLSASEAAGSAPAASDSTSIPEAPKSAAARVESAAVLSAATAATQSALPAPRDTLGAAQRNVLAAIRSAASSPPAPPSGRTAGDSPAKRPAAGAEPSKPAPKSVPPVPIQKVQPVYPDLARKMKVSGIVELWVRVDAAGRVTDVSPLNGPSLLHAASVEAVRHWQFKPALIDGVPTLGDAKVAIVFRDPNDARPDNAK